VVSTWPVPISRLLEMTIQFSLHLQLLFKLLLPLLLHNLLQLFNHLLSRLHLQWQPVTITVTETVCSATPTAALAGNAVLFPVLLLLLLLLIVAPPANVAPPTQCCTSCSKQQCWKCSSSACRPGSNRGVESTKGDLATNGGFVGKCLDL